MGLFNSTFVFAAGLEGLKNTILDQWLAPAFVIFVAVLAIKFLKDRQWMQLLGFVGIAAVVGLLMFGSEGLFGKDGSATSVAKDAATQVADGGGSGSGGGGGRAAGK